MQLLTDIARISDRVTRRIALALSIVAGLAVALIVLVLFVSSVQRYVLTSPIPATEEIAAYLFVTVAFFAVMEAMVAGRHIRVLPVWNRLPQRLQGWMMILGHVLSLGVLGILIMQTFKFAWASRRMGARSYVADLLEWPWMMILPLAFAALALALAARLVVDLDLVLRGEPVEEARGQATKEIV